MSGVHDRPRHLVIRTERDGGDRVRLSVQDAGIGLESASPSAARSSRVITAGSGPRRISVREPRLRSLFPASQILAYPPTRLRTPGLLSRPTRHPLRAPRDGPALTRGGGGRRRVCPRVAARLVG
jgi:hypothetical protein